MIGKKGGEGMKEPKRLQRDLAFKGNIIDFYKDTIEMPTGHVVQYDFIGHKGAAAIVPVMKNGNILMVRQYRDAIDRFTLEIPAGGREGLDEPTMQCAAREMEEETGYRSEHIEPLIEIYTSVAFCNEKIDIYVAFDLIPSNQHLDEDEFIDVQEVSVDQLTKLILEGKIMDAKTVAAILAYKEKYLIKNTKI